MERKFEIHFALAKIEKEEYETLTKGLENLRVTKQKFFYNVYNVPIKKSGIVSSGEVIEIEDARTSHDIKDPFLMITHVCESYQEAKNMVHKLIKEIEKTKKEYNFEIEQVINGDIKDITINLEEDFKEHKAAEKRPLYENHIIWRGTEKELPDYKTIIKWVRDEFDTTAHQIVDFGRSFEKKEGTPISRVATIYQQDREAALAIEKKKREYNENGDPTYLITEQVCLVIEAKSIS